VTGVTVAFAVDIVFVVVTCRCAAVGVILAGGTNRARARRS